jgi:hypothetical protein
VKASTEAKLTMAEPAPMRGRAAAVTLSTPSTLMSKMRRNDASSYVASVVGG